MKASFIITRILIVLGSLLMLAVSAGVAWAAVADYETRGLVSKGVTVVGRDMTGMTEAQARTAIEDSVMAPLHRPVTVAGDGKTWTLDPKGIVSVDVDTMLSKAYLPRRTSTFVQRVDSTVRDTPIAADIKPEYSIDTSAVTAWVNQAAAQIDRKPKDATRKIVKNKYKFKFTREVYGARTNKAGCVQVIASALTADAALATESRVVTLPITSLKPKVLTSSFKTAIIVSLPRCKIYLYKGTKLVKSYSCAPGRPAFPTPQGDFKIDTKLHNAPWINPGSAWAAGMPASIPPGPYNPMGVHKIGINWPGVFMHGIPPGEFGSIGTHASHGCMRMMPSAVKDLFGRVHIGDPVYIRG